MIKFSIKYVIILIVLSFVFKSNAATYYVNVALGNDTYNGLSSTYIGGINGPKKTIGAGITLAGSGDNVNVAGGIYKEDLIVKKNVNLINSLPVTVNGIEMNGASYRLNIIGNSLYIVSTLKLTAGIIDVSSCLEFRLNATGKLTGGSSSSFIDGTFYRECNVLKAKYIFPIGKGKDYRPVTIDILQTNTNVNIYSALLNNTAFTLGNTPLHLNRISNLRHWNIGQTANNIKNLIVTLQYSSSTSNDEVFTPNYLRIVKANGNAWLDLGGKGSLPKNGSISTTRPVTKGGIFTIANQKGGRNPLGHDRPIAAFAKQGKCVGKNVFFTDSSFSTRGPIAKWSWDFGDLTTSTDVASTKNASYTYKSRGPFTVTLIVEDSKGQKDKFTRRVTLNNNPVAKFKSAPTCFGRPTQFKDSSILKLGTIKSREWAFGDGNVSNSINPTNLYGKFGSFDVSLKVISDNGCFDIARSKAIVYKKPEADFTTANICLGDVTFFEDKSNSTDKIKRWKYTIETKGDSNKRDVAVRFKLAKKYNIRQIIETINGCQDTTNKTIEIFNNPIAQFELDPRFHSLGDTLQCFKVNHFKFKNTSAKLKGQVITSNWIYNGQKKTQTDFDIRYNQVGQQLVKLLIRTDKGCKDSINKTIALRDKITPDFTVKDLCFGQNTQFEDISVTDKNNILFRQWSLGNGVNDILKQTNTTYASLGSFDVRLIVSTKHCQDTIEKKITIGNPPVLTYQFSPDHTFCYGKNTIVNITGADSYKWFDGNTNSTRIFDSTGTHKLTSTSKSGCMADTTVRVTMREKVNVNIISNDTTIAKGRRIKLLLNADTDLGFKWKPSTYMANDTSYYPSSRPLDNIKYTVTATDKFGCIGVDSIQINVTDPDLVKINNIITPDGDGKNDLWDISEIPFSESCNVQVYDTWGKKVFESSNYNSQWDGTYKNKPLPEGSYMYIISCSVGGKVFKGVLHIIK